MVLCKIDKYYTEFAGWLAQICDENPRMRTLLVEILN